MSPGPRYGSKVITITKKLPVHIIKDNISKTLHNKEGNTPIYLPIYCAHEMQIYNSFVTHVLLFTVNV